MRAQKSARCPSRIASPVICPRLTYRDYITSSRITRFESPGLATSIRISGYSVNESAPSQCKPVQILLSESFWRLAHLEARRLSALAGDREIASHGLLPEIERMRVTKLAGSQHPDFGHCRIEFRMIR